MDTSPLNKLPAELRNQIYTYLLIHQGPISIQVHSSKPTTSSFKDEKDKIAITETCRQLRRESLDIFYSVNTFTIMTKFLEDTGWPWTPKARQPFHGIRVWLKDCVTPKFACRLNRVCIDLGWFSIEGHPERVTESMEVARIETRSLQSESVLGSFESARDITTSSIPAHACLVRAAYFVEVFPPIGVTMRYIDIPLGDREAAVRLLEETTRGAKAGLPGYSANRADVEYTMDLFMHGVKRMIF